MSNEQTIPEEKPLNQSQLKNLREVVSGDFIDLKEQVRLDIERRKWEKIDEIKQRYADTSDIDGFKDRLRQMQRDFEDNVQSLLREAQQQGVVPAAKPSGARMQVYDLDVEPDNLVHEGKTQEIQEVKQAAVDMENTALRVLNREDRSVQRQCLLQGISATGAHQLINDIPQRDDIMPLVAAELAMHSAKAMETLMSDEEKSQAEITGEETE